MDSEIKNTIYIAISCALLAIILGFVMIMMNIQEKIATNRNGEVVGKQHVREFNEYSAFDDTRITGLQLIRLVTEADDKNLEVYVSGINDSDDKDGNGDASSQYFTHELYIKNMHSKPENNIYNVNDAANTSTEGKPGDISDCWLVKMYAPNTTKASSGVYFAYLVYNGENPSTAVQKEFDGNATVTGVHVIYVGG